MDVFFRGSQPWISCRNKNIGFVLDDYKEKREKKIGLRELLRVRRRVRVKDSRMVLGPWCHSISVHNEYPMTVNLHK